MNAREEGFLLLTSHLGDPDRKPLTTAQLRTLWARVRGMDAPEEEQIKAYTEQIKCMLDLELLTLEDANVTLTMYKRLEEADKWKSLNKEE